MKKKYKVYVCGDESVDNILSIKAKLFSRFDSDEIDTILCDAAKDTPLYRIWQAIVNEYGYAFVSKFTDQNLNILQCNAVYCIFKHNATNNSCFAAILHAVEYNKIFLYVNL